MQNNKDKFMELVSFKVSANRSKANNAELSLYEEYLKGVQFALSTFGMKYDESTAKVEIAENMPIKDAEQVNEEYSGKFSEKHRFLEGAQLVAQTAQNFEMNTSVLDNLLKEIN